ncbi:glycosyltransferase family 2 protein [Shewanella psychropiezotolerans]|uniref:Glycosyltransferase family 2 protein n=1 Tax=Shewanella psychropiezotolerans TaxID=2593655 RepID=A0ABX5WXB2_9GAMM|nr:MULTISPECIES: glycosyltransferase family 2 protein [Shewanella]MPY24937.1 glycosyltransferase family 2 protein [Shewanella sp. YLB-07]QDO83431.1 glycosyltransferase family 2 protein [Shewanella psychropiezotolerans]
MKVSVLILSYNFEPYIEACLLSVLTQITDFDFEVLCIDDASSDNSASVIKALATQHTNLHFFENKVNLDGKLSLIKIMQASTGHYLIFMDGDDLALPGKLQAMVNYLEQHPECALVYHEAESFDSATNQTLGYWSRDFYNWQYIPQQANAEHLVKYGTFLNTSSVGFRRHDKMVDAIDGSYGLVGDYSWHILNTMYAGGSIDFINQVYGRYRVHNNNCTSRIKSDLNRREACLDSQIWACDKALALGMDNDTVAKGKAHHYFATAMYFLKLHEDARFTRFITESATFNQFFDARHHLAWELRENPNMARAKLFIT